MLLRLYDASAQGCDGSMVLALAVGVEVGLASEHGMRAALGRFLVDVRCALEIMG